MTNKMTLSEELRWRGLLNQTTYEDLSVIDSEENKITFYHGFDASSDSQTIGNLAAMMLDLCFLRHGHKALVLAGGATSLVGDPGGKDSERPLQTVETIAHNVECAKRQLLKIYSGYEFTMVNNIDWTRSMSVIDFLRDVGKFFNVGEMIKKDFISTRIGEGGSGISYTEFSYTLLQGMDFLHLFDNYGCTLQLGGSDQWGNCISGVDLIRKARNAESHVMTLPLIINKSTGKKFGKSEAGAVWLDQNKTSVFDFYQFWINTDDESAQDYVKIFTAIDKDQYDALIEEFNQDRSKRALQKYLAFNVTKLVHGEAEACSARDRSESIFSEVVDIDSIENTATVKMEYVQDAHNPETGDVVGKVVNMVELLAGENVLSSKREARDFLTAGAVSINDKKVEAHGAVDFSSLELPAVLKVGKKKYFKLI